MEAVPLHLREANEFVAEHHRHNLPTVGGKFAVGATLEGNLVGVAVAGRPVARRPDDGKTLEVRRVGAAQDCAVVPATRSYSIAAYALDRLAAADTPVE
jgi:hypothetical protein